MRVDERKSITLTDPAKMTPATNLMNGQWRKSFSDALQKLSATTVDINPAALDAANAMKEQGAREFQARNELPASAPTPVLTKGINQGEGQQLLDLVNSASAHSPGLGHAYAEGRLPISTADITPRRDLAAGAVAGSVAGHGANVIAKLLSMYAPHMHGSNLVSNVLNLAVPAAVATAVPRIKDPRAELDLRALHPELTDAAIVARNSGVVNPETNTITEGTDPNAIREGYKAPFDPYAGYRTPTDRVTEGQANELANSEMNMSAKLFPAHTLHVPGTMGALGAAFTVAGDVGARMDPQYPSELKPTWGDTAVNASTAAALPIAAYAQSPAARNLALRATLVGGLRSPAIAAALNSPAAARLAAPIGGGLVAALPSGVRAAGRFVGGPIGAGLLSVLSGGRQLLTAKDADIRQKIVEEGLRTDRSGLGRLGSVVGSTLAGSPLDAAATALGNNPEIRAAAEGEINAQRDSLRDRLDPQGDVVTNPATGQPFKQRVNLNAMRASAGALVSNMRGIPSSEVADIARDAVSHPSGIDYINSRHKLTPEQAQAAAAPITQTLADTLQAPLTQDAVSDIQALVQHVGPEAAQAALLNDMQRRAFVYLSSGWTTNETNHTALAHYHTLFPPTVAGR